MQVLKGQVERVVFHSEENGYTVARLHPQDQDSLVTIVGNLVSIQPGIYLSLKGEWLTHAKYGNQFKVAEYKQSAPESIQGLTNYLASGMIHGIGPEMAKRIVERFGKDTLEIIENSPECLAEIPGIGVKRVQMIRQAWDEQRDIRDVMIFLQTHGVTPGLAVKIYKRFGRESIETVKENPYKLTEIWGIGFLTADQIAKNLGFSDLAPTRLLAGVLYVLEKMVEQGHVFYPRPQLVNQCEEILQVDQESIGVAIEQLDIEGRITIDRDRGIDEIYLTPYYICESQAACRLIALKQARKPNLTFKPERAIAWVENQIGLKLDEKQVQAVQLACHEKVMVLTGGPGTGKTTIISALIRVYSQIQARIMLAAPTGRAAKKMTEATGFEAKTIHRLLEYSMQTGGFMRNDKNQLECDLLIVDEASMIDMMLLHHLLKAVPPKATLILVGDVDQLPSVGCGSCLRDIISSGAIPTVRLDTIFRQAQASQIIVNSHRINEGLLPEYGTTGKNDFFILEREQPEDILKTILGLVSTSLPTKYRFNPMTDIQVLSPMHKGLIGVGNINTELQQILNPAGRQISASSLFRIGDKVMQIRNNYDKEVFNGDVGLISAWLEEEKKLAVVFDGREVLYEQKDMDELVLAYATTVHKAQGSEYPVVVIPVSAQHYIMLQRNMLYTAVTRGKQMVFLVGTRKALAIACKNNKIQKRFSNLKDRLRPDIAGGK